MKSGQTLGILNRKLKVEKVTKKRLALLLFIIVRVRRCVAWRLMMRYGSLWLVACEAWLVRSS